MRPGPSQPSVSKLEVSEHAAKTPVKAVSGKDSHGYVARAM